MSARYQVPVSGELLEAWDQSLLPEGMRVVEVGPLDYAKRCHMVTMDDDSAPEELSGKTVYPLFRVQPDRSVVIVGRDVIS